MISRRSRPLTPAGRGAANTSVSDGSSRAGAAPRPAQRACQVRHDEHDDEHDHESTLRQVGPAMSRCPARAAITPAWNRLVAPTWAM